MSSSIQFKRGTRAQVNDLALKGGLLEGEPLFITDERRLVVADNANNFSTIGKSVPSFEIKDTAGSPPQINLRSPTSVNQYYIGANISDSVDDGLHFGKGSGIGGTLMGYFNPSGHLMLPLQPAASGNLSAYTTNTSDYNPSIFNLWLNRQCTVNTSLSRITAWSSGYYIVHAQQLVSTVAQTCYFCIRKNGTVIAYAYSNADNTYDLNCTVLVDLINGDYIDFYYGGTTTETWGGPHSHFFFHKVS